MKKSILLFMGITLVAGLYARPQKSGHWVEVPDYPYALTAPQDKDIKEVSEKLKKQWADPVLQEEIELGIKTNRMGSFYVGFFDSKGRPVKVDNVSISLKKHEFLFGMQAFLMEGFHHVEKDAKLAQEKNRKFEELFANLFNFATLPFYWATSEPEPGFYRFSRNENKPDIYRRPPPDVVLEMCKRHDITPKGHCLSWHLATSNASRPKWVPESKHEYEKYMCRYIDKVAERYDGKIDYWDVTNENTDKRHTIWSVKTPDPHGFMPDDYGFKAFKEAERVFRVSNRFISNYTTPVWQRVAAFREYSADYLAISDLINRGAKLDVIGLQLHFFAKEDYQNALKGIEWGPEYQRVVLDTLSRFNRPIHITEITFPCFGDGEVGEANQAFFVENFYKLWFSHKNVEAITYWHFVDGTAGGEDRFMSGFLRKDMSKKPSYVVLENLLKKWRTDLNFDSVDDKLHFRAFYGKYLITYEYNGKKYEKTVNLSAKDSNRYKKIFVE